jgi:radical SAM superfamily enzyme YgiQ (UPF0313 family)
MKIALIIPKNGSHNGKSFYDYKFFTRFLLTQKYFSYLLAVPALVSLTPKEHEIRVFDENIEDIDYTWDADLAGISVRTMFAQRAYEISASFRKRGIRTVLGGIHPSMCPDEARQHSDAIVVGEAEEVWRTLLQDAENGELKRIYKADQKADLKAYPAAVRAPLAKSKYLLDMVQTTKGCPFHCEFCSVYAFDGQKIRSKTVDQVLQEIKDINVSGGRYKKKAILFADDNILANRKYARQLFHALKPLNLNWSCQASINISRDEEILGLMREAGCGAVFIGLESISEKNLSRMDKGVNRRHDYIDAIQKIQSHGMLVQGSFILGYDFDTQSSFDELIHFISETRLLMPLINILTPFPGTKLFERLDKEGRILHKDWSAYDAKSVVFSPSLMTPEELLQGHRRVLREVYSFDAIYKKLAYYWDRNFWETANRKDPVKLKYRLLFAFRLCTLLFSPNLKRSALILKILPKVFNKRVRISTILTLMAYNDYAYTA